MKFTNEPIELRTSRLLLRPLRVDDAEYIFAFGSDPEFARFWCAEPSFPQNIDVMMAYIKNSRWEDRPDFAILLNEDVNEDVIGEVYLNVHQSDLTGELGYAIARPHWGKGYAAEAAQAVVDYGFAVCELAKVFAVVDPRNIGSVRVLEKLGMRQEALLRSHVVRRGERAERMYFGMLRKEWETKVNG